MDNHYGSYKASPQVMCVALETPSNYSYHYHHSQFSYSIINQLTYLGGPRLVLPSGKPTKNYGQSPFIVSFPTKKKVIFHNFL